MPRLPEVIADLGEHVPEALMITEAEPLSEPGPRIVWVNRAMVALSGYEADELVGRTPRILQGPESYPRTRAQIRRALDGWRDVRAELMNYRKSGERFWAGLHIRPIAGADGRVDFWIGSLRDLTAEKMAEATHSDRLDALRAETERVSREHGDLAGYAALLDMTDELVTVCDPAFRIRWANAAFLARNGLELDAIRGRTLCDVTPKQVTRFEPGAVAIEALIKGRCDVGECRTTTPGGEVYWTYNTVRARPGEPGRPAQLVLFEREITEDRRERFELRSRSDLLEALVEDRTRVVRAQSDELSRALASQKRLNDQQIQFIRMASHEFRTPMSVIAMATRQLRRRLRGVEVEGAEERLVLIDDAIARLSKLVESTLFLAKVDAGKFEFDMQAVDLRAWIAERVAQERRAGGAHEIRFETACAGRAEIRADPTLLEHIFDNVIGNAKKYSPDADRIEIRVWEEDRSVRVAVRDFGVGVGAEDLGKLGQRYFRASTANGVSGTGIGLTVVKQFVDLLGGALTIESVEGEGSTFTVILPLASDNRAHALEGMVEGAA